MRFLIVTKKLSSIFRGPSFPQQFFETDFIRERPIKVLIPKNREGSELDEELRFGSD